MTKEQINTSKEKRKIIIILAIILIFAITISVIYISSNKKDNNSISNKLGEEIINENKEVISDKEVSNILFSNIKYTYDGKTTKVALKITNNNDKTAKLGVFIVNAYDKNKEKIGALSPIYEEGIKSKETIELNFSIEQDLSKAYSIEFELPQFELID